MESKHFLTLSIFIFLSTHLFAGEDPKSILLEMRNRLNEIHNGSYKANYVSKPGSSKKYYTFSASCDFEKIPVNSDSCYIKYRFVSTQGWRSIYNGENRFLLEEDSTATVIDSKKYSDWGTYMRGNTNSHLLFDYFFKTKKYNNEFDSSYQYSFLKDTIMENAPCYVIHCFKARDGDVSNYNKDMVVRKSDFIPLKVTTNLDWDDMHQFDEILITDLILNDTKISIGYSIDSIPSYYNLTTYEDGPEKELLKVGSKMPKWELNTLTGTKMESTKLNSKLTLIDFWYKGCGPCIKAIPGIQKLYADYKEKGFLVLGFNVYDKNDDDLKGFLSYRKVTYPVFTDAKSTAEKFNVDCYPTFYLVNNKGTIIYSSKGYNEELENKLRKKIEEELKK